MSAGAADRGSGTVLLLAVVGAAVSVAAMLGLLGSAQLARGRAQTAADLGALAGASRLLDAAGDPCELAGEVVGRNGARLAGCVDEGGGVVTVRVVVPGPAGDAVAAARAGPASARG
ncbi:Rv3654c family TadE-like protein [Cellulomonas sp. P5_C6]